MRLSDCRPGQGGRVRLVDGSGPLAQRLMELGFVEGTNVRVIRIAPFGGPMQISVERSLLSIRRAEAESVELLV